MKNENYIQRMSRIDNENQTIDREREAKHMRDPNRIDEVHASLLKCWKLAPDIRFGQLIFNIHKMYADGKDMFYIEDDQWLEWINKYSEYCAANYYHATQHTIKTAQQIGEALQKVIDRNNRALGD